MLKEMYLGNTIQEWVFAAGTFAVVFLLLIALRHLIRKKLKVFTRRTSTSIDDLIVEVMGRTRYIVLALVALYFASLNLTMSDTVRGALSGAARVAILFQIGIWCSAAVTHLIKGKVSEDGKHASRAAIVFAVKLILWSIVLLVALDNVGVNVTALITGLGIGGVAVALAMQNILGDLFASMSITLDEPFLVGDVIAIDTIIGTVEQVGLKTTRLKSISGEQVVLANTDLLNSRIRNYGRMQERRVVFTLGVTYQTPHATLERIPGLIREIVAAYPGARFDRAHLQKFGDSALVYEVVYFVTDPDYTRYMDIQQGINLDICRVFESHGIHFAYPTHTVYVNAQAPPASPPA